MNLKKKLTAAALVVAFGATAVTGATLAYFTDTDEATNTFTMGNVSIDLQEVFDKDNAKLIPGANNAINKDVTILNDGTNDAYVWYEWFIPSVLDSTDGSTGTNNIVHVNSLGRTWDTYRENPKYWAEDQTEALPLEKTWNHDSLGTQGFVGTETIDGIQYNKYISLYRGVLKANETTTQAMDQVYLDSKVDYDGQNYTINGKTIDYDFTKNVNIIVKAYGIQANGLTDENKDGKVDVFDAYRLYNAQANTQIAAE